MVAILDKVEAIPIVSGTNREKVNAHNKIFSDVYDLAETILKEAKATIKRSLAHRKLQWHFEALNFRVSNVSRLHDHNKIQALQNKCKAWMEGQICFANKNADILLKNAINSLCLLSTRQINILLKSEWHFDRFAKWTLRDNNSAEIFFKYPWMAALLKQKKLSQPIGLSKKNAFLIEEEQKEEGVKQHILTLPFERWRYNIHALDTQVELTGKTATIGEIFAEAGQAARRWTCFDYYANSGGFRHFYPPFWGYLDEETKRVVHPDFTKKDWQKKLPNSWIVSKDEAQAMFPQATLNGQPVLGAAASQRYLDHRFNKNHAWLVFAEPLENGDYRIYDIGKFTFPTFPYTTAELLPFFGNTVRGTLVPTDPNRKATNRLHTYYAKSINEEEAKVFWQKIGKIAEECVRDNELFALDPGNCQHQGTMPFQVQGLSCAAFTEAFLIDFFNSINQEFPHVFRASRIKTTPEGFMGAIGKAIRLLPKTGKEFRKELDTRTIDHYDSLSYWQWLKETGRILYRAPQEFALNVFNLFFIPWRKGVFYIGGKLRKISLVSATWNQRTYLPTMLRHRLAKGKF